MMDKWRRIAFVLLLSSLTSSMVADNGAGNSSGLRQQSEAHNQGGEQKLAPVGGEFQINTYTFSSQYRQAVAFSPDGNFVVVWTSSGSSGTDTGPSVQGQRFASDGTPVGGEFQVNTYTFDFQEDPAVAFAPDGDFVVVWSSYGSNGSDTSRSSIQGQRFAPNGTPVAGEFQVNSYTFEYQQSPAIAFAPNGGFVVVWDSADSGGGDTSISVQGQRFAPDGTPTGDEFQVNTVTTGNQRNPAVGSGPNGDFVVVWDSRASGGSFPDIEGQRFAADGTFVGAEFRAIDFGIEPSIAVGPGGDFVVVGERRDSPSSGYSIQGQRLAANGMLLGDVFQVNTYNTLRQTMPAVAVDFDGDFVVVWKSDGSYGSDTSDTSVQGQRFAFDGTVLGDEFQVNTYTTSFQGGSLLNRGPAVAAGPNGEFLVAWGSDGSSGTDSSVFSVQGQRFAPVADLSISKDDGVTSAIPGQTVTYTIVAMNNGPDPAAMVQVSDLFPTVLTCEWTSVAAGGATGNSSAAGDLDDTLTMPVASSVTYTVTCVIDPDATGFLSNTATISSPLADLVLGNNSATDGDTELEPRLVVEVPTLSTLGLAMLLLLLAGSGVGALSKRRRRD